VTCREYVKKPLDKFEALTGYNLAKLAIQPDDPSIDKGSPDAGAKRIPLKRRPTTLI